MAILTAEQICSLQAQGCVAEDWANISVCSDFDVKSLHDVSFYGKCVLGSFDGTISVDGVPMPCGISNATLHNVTLGNGCLVRNVHGCMSGVVLGDNCLVSNVGTIRNDADATYAEGETFSVLNEGGDGNIVLTRHLTAQLAWLMVRYPAVYDFVRKEAAQPVERTAPNGVVITGVKDMRNVALGDNSVLTGCTLLDNVTVLSTADAITHIGHDVIMENCVVAEHATVDTGAKLAHCFVGETVHIGKGFSAEASVFFANAYMDNGEACAAFCGPFATSHHKSTLLIGGEFSFYNAGSNTNQSNHAYKMGPIHWGVLERGSKTASGCHILWPATVGSFSMVMGKVQSHPDVRNLPFSYLIAEGRDTYLVPGINLCTVGTWRDVGKWPKRDKRPESARRDIINFAYLNPVVIQEVVAGKKLLKELLAANPEAAVLEYGGCRIRRSSAEKGIKYYNLALLLYIYNVSRAYGWDELKDGKSEYDVEWCDAAGLLMPKPCAEQIAVNLANGRFTTLKEAFEHLTFLDDSYRLYDSVYAAHIIKSELSDIANVQEAAEAAYAEWVSYIREDANKEYRMGDVEDAQLKDFLASLPE